MTEHTDTNANTSANPDDTETDANPDDTETDANPDDTETDANPGEREAETASATPYDGARDHLRDELRRLDLLLRRYLDAWRAERGGAGEGGGLYVSDAQVDRLLRVDPLGSGERQPRGRTDGVDDRHDGVDDRLRRHTERMRRRERATSRELPLVALADRFGLGRRHVDALLVALGPELDLKYETVYAYLQDDLTRKRPTVGLTLGVVGGTVGSQTTERALFTPGSPLLDGRLLRLSGEGEAVLSQAVEVDRRIVAALLDEEAFDPALAGVAEPVDPDAVRPSLVAPDAGSDASPIERLPVARSTRDRLAAVAGRIDSDSPAMLHLSGPYGSGRTTAAAALAAETGRSLVGVDADRIPTERASEMLALVTREARLRDAAIHVRDLLATEEREQAGTVDTETLIERLDTFDGPVFLSGETSLPPRLGARLDRHAFVPVELDRPSFDLRRALWAQLDLPGTPEELASKFLFTPGQIEDAAATARSLAEEKPTAADVYEACRAQSRERLGDLARHVEPTYDWDDIVLPTEESRQLREVVAHVEHQGTVYAEWGFEDRFSHGTGVNVLFAGPSGTGKTMAAEIVASEAGLDLYAIDLASVVSKYIGETESNLGRVFDAAEASNAVLFFDEADALFGKRSEVSDAHDRYANVEVDYLLQRMEAHDGVVLLATNLEENLDDAFQRRINVTVEFPRPDREARERIWRGVFPAETPVGDLDWAFLAGFELSGGGITNAALTAAFLAADSGERVEMRHAVVGLWRELQKGGRLVSPADFGQYREYLP